MRDNDSLFEAVFRQAVIDNHEQELREIPSDSVLRESLVFSQAHQQRMAKLLQKAKKTGSLGAARRMVACVLLAFTLAFGLMMTSQSVRAAVGDTLIQWFGKFTQFTTSSQTSQNPEVEEWILTYLPEGFTEVMAHYGGASAILYANAEGVEIQFGYTSIWGSSSVNNEDITYSTFEKDDIIYHVFAAETEDASSVIVWEKNKLRFTIASTLGMDEIVVMAYSAQKNN